MRARARRRRSRTSASTSIGRSGGAVDPLVAHGIRLPRSSVERRSRSSRSPRARPRPRAVGRRACAAARSYQLPAGVITSQAMIRCGVEHARHAEVAHLPRLRSRRRAARPGTSAAGRYRAGMPMPPSARARHTATRTASPPPRSVRGAAAAVAAGRRRRRRRWAPAKTPVRPASVNDSVVPAGAARRRRRPPSSGQRPWPRASPSCEARPTPPAVRVAVRSPVWDQPASRSRRPRSPSRRAASGAGGVAPRGVVAGPGSSGSSVDEAGGGVHGCGDVAVGRVEEGAAHSQTPDPRERKSVPHARRSRRGRPGSPPSSRVGRVVASITRSMSARRAASSRCTRWLRPGLRRSRSTG